MFTGIITNIGIVKNLQSSEKEDLLIEISTINNIQKKLDIGCSIACNGVCLTLIKKEALNDKISLFFQASKETLDKSNLKFMKINDEINLEFAMQIGDEFGGHMVLGHVDDCAKIIAIEKIQDSLKFTFETKKDLMKFIAKKGSITINGTSLTVNEIGENSFEINLIKHSFENTNFKNYKINDLVNLEVDMIARYLERLNS